MSRKCNCENEASRWKLAVLKKASCGYTIDTQGRTPALKLQLTGTNELHNYIITNE